MKKGFTLIEVLIVIIILGILATLAIPQFTKMTRRARLAEAWGGLGGVRTAQAIYYMEKNRYAGAISDLDFDAPSTLFTYSIDAASSTNFTAAASGGSSGDASGITAWISQAATSYVIK